MSKVYKITKKIQGELYICFVHNYYFYFKLCVYNKLSVAFNSVHIFFIHKYLLFHILPQAKHVVLRIFDICVVTHAKNFTLC